MFSEDWVERSQLLSNPHVDLYFLISIKNLDEVPTLVGLNKLEELISVYRSVISNSNSRGTNFNEIEHEFWVRPRIDDGTGVTKHSFSWYDHLDESSRFLEWLNDSDAEHEFADMDQGWAFAARKIQDNVHMLEFNPDSNMELENTFLPHRVIFPLFSSAFERANKIVSALSESVGEDVWSKYRGYEWDTVKFGNGEWEP